jgi:protein tyrosine/serine phosphatase
MSDYLLTNDESRMARKMAFLGPWLRDTAGVTVGDDALRVAVSVHPQYLETAFAAINEVHGSTDAYLETVLGVDAALREKLHERLLA